MFFKVFRDAAMAYAYEAMFMNFEVVYVFKKFGSVLSYLLIIGYFSKK